MTAIQDILIVFVLASIFAIVRSTVLYKRTRLYAEAREKRGENGIMKLLLAKRRIRYAAIDVLSCMTALSGVLFFWLTVPAGAPEHIAQEWRSLTSFVAYLLLLLIPVVLAVYLEYDSRSEATVEREAKQVEAKAKEGNGGEHGH
jgi:hypothetical protein